MEDWCPLFGRVDPAWPERARAVVAEARRILGAKRGTKAATFDPSLLEKVRELFALAPEWIALWSSARAQSDALYSAFPGLAYEMLRLDTERARRHLIADPQSDRLGACVLAIYAARQGRIDRSADMLLHAESALTHAAAASRAVGLAGARKGGRKHLAEKPSLRALVIKTARRLLAEGKLRRGLAKWVAKDMGPERYTARHINRILKDNGI